MFILIFLYRFKRIFAKLTKLTPILECFSV